MARWRTVGGAVAVSVGATVTVATVAEAGVAQADRPSVVTVHHTTTAAAPAPLGAVTVHDLDPSVVARTLADPPQSVTQVVQLTVIGGGLTLETTTATIVLEQASDREWVGDLPPVRVVDARGTHEGWDVRWSVDAIDVTGSERDVPPAAVRVDPGSPVVVAGLAEGIAPGKAGPGVGKNGRTLFEAETGWGGGTYEADGTVTVRLPKAFDATSVTVHLTFALA